MAASWMPTWLTPLLLCLGSLTIARATFVIARFVHLHFLRASSIRKYLHKSSDGDSPAAWALVTGASDGIGLAIATQLAVTGFNVVLHGRNPTRLAAARDHILQTLRPSRTVQVQTVVADATAPPREAAQSIAAIVATLSSLPAPGLTVLVNNVGGVPVPGSPYAALLDQDAATVDAILDLNLRFGLHLTRRLGPLLRANGAAGTGAGSLVVNFGSAAGEVGIPYIGVYSAAKAGIVSWSKALSRELGMAAEGARGGVEVIALLIGVVSGTQGQREAAASWVTRAFVPSAEAFARAALGKVGCGRVVVVGHWGHALQFGLMGQDGWLSEGVGGEIVKRVIGDKLEKNK